MASAKPKFIDSPYYKDGKLQPGAPADLVREYKEFLEGDEAEDVVIPTLTAADLKK